MPTIDEELVQNGKAVFNSQVIINSANDLKTKDESSFGGDSDDIFEIDLNRFTPNSEGELVATLTDEEVTKILKAQFINMLGESGFILIRFGTDYVFNSTNINSEGIGVIGYTLYAYNVATTKQIKMVVTQDELSLSNYATKDELNAKQSKLYRHSVLISTPTNKTAYLSFTAESDKNTSINSIQNLIAVFRNTSIACSGIYRDSDPSNEQSLLMINVGTSISNTTISSATISNSAITDFSNAPFTDTFGSTGFTITDNVTAM